MNTRSESPLARRARHHHTDRSLLLEAAEKIFSQRGYYATSIRHIAREAGFSVGGVYQFFKSKDDLYLAVIEAQWTQFFQAIDPALKAKGFPTQIAALAEAWLAYFDSRRAFFQIYLSDRNRFAGTFRDRVARSVARKQARLRQRVERLMRQAAVRRHVRFADSRFLASVYIGMLHNCILDALSSSGRKTADATAVVSLFLHGAERP